jgi:hypothetical protein
MEPFVFSALLAFVVFEFLLYIDIPPEKGLFQVGDVKVNFNPQSAKWAHWVLIAFLVFLTLLAVLLLHQLWSPLSPISRHKTNVILGFLFGPIFAIWLNSIFSHPAAQPLSRGLLAGGLGLVLLCFIGAAGDQTGKLFEKIGRKISGVKGFGVEVSLSESGKKHASQGATSLAGSAGSPNFAPNVGSAGLEYISVLDDIIGRDKDYLRAVYGQKALSQLDVAQGLARFLIRPPMKCLAAWLQATANTGYVNDRLRPFVTALRQVPTLTSDQRRSDVSKSFVRSISVIALEVETFAAPGSVEKECLPLITIFCPTFVIPPDKIPDRPGLVACLTAPDRSSGEKDISEKLGQFVAEEGWQTRPYFAIAQASVMAQLGEYTAAANILDDWLQQYKTASAGHSTSIGNWFEIRVRSMLAAYFEEWLLKLGDAAATSLREEHLKNLGLLRVALGELVAKRGLPVVSKTDVNPDKSIAFEVPGPCTMNNTSPDLELSRQLFSSYVSMELTHIQNRLRHPKYKEKYVETTNADITRLTKLDLSCLSAYPPSDLVYAQILDSYALNNVQYVDANKETISSNEKDERYSAAGQAITFATEITAAHAQQDLNRSQGTFLKRIEPSDWVSTQESLDQTSAKLNSAMND